jgi:ABC-type nitrate/sulfonate/bicarbonate transport system substrate-binding protein
MRKRTVLLLAIPLATTLVLAGCGGDDDDSADATTTVEGGGTAAAASLKGVCPDTVVIQTDWFPEAEHGATYQLLGDGYTADTDAKKVTGPLVAGGQDTGVKVEIRTGGPSIGDQTVSAVMKQDPSILIGYVSTDEQVSLSGQIPTVAVLAPLEKNPQFVMWDPGTYPEAKTIADLKADKVRIRYFAGSTYMDYLIAKGDVDPSQADSSYTGDPSLFIADGGTSAQQGFVSAEPYTYETILADEWGKPVSYQLIHDTGWELYSQALVVTPETLESQRACLEKLVPIMQQAIVDYGNDPAATDAKIVDLVEQYATFWQYDLGQAKYSLETQKKLGLVGNGPDATVGNFDPARVEAFVATAIPVFESLGKQPKAGLKATDLYTNEFIDESIGI